MMSDSEPTYSVPVGRRLPEDRSQRRSVRQLADELPPAPTLKDFKHQRRLFRERTVYGNKRGEVAILPAKYPMFWIGLLLAILWFPAVEMLITEWDDIYSDRSDAQFFARLGVLGSFALGLSMMFTRFWAHRYGHMMLSDGKQITVRQGAQTSTFAISSVQRIVGGEVARQDEDGDPIGRHYYTIIHSGSAPGYVSMWSGADEPIWYLKRVRPDIKFSRTGARQPPKDIPNFFSSFFLLILIVTGVVVFLTPAGLLKMK